MKKPLSKTSIHWFDRSNVRAVLSPSNIANSCQSSLARMIVRSKCKPVLSKLNRVLLQRHALCPIHVRLDVRDSAFVQPFYGQTSDHTRKQCVQGTSVPDSKSCANKFQHWMIKFARITSQILLSRPQRQMLEGQCFPVMGVQAIASVIQRGDASC